MNEWVGEALVEWCWWRKIEVLKEKPVPVPFCPPQISGDRTWVFSVTGWWLSYSYVTA